MRIAIIGLGRMGINMARRLLRGGHEVVAYNRTTRKTDEIAAEGGVPVYTLSELARELTPPRTVWMMLPAGPVVEETILGLKEVLSPGDMVVDGGNTHYKDDLLRSETLSKQGIRFVDVGVSGGIWGLKNGFCLMIGGPEDACRFLDPVFKTLAPEDGYLHCGPVGAGHFLKMVHNGIEYAMMQAYGEGFQLLEASPYAGEISHADVAHLWNQGSVVRSWLLELAETAFSRCKSLSQVTGYVEDSGEGRWMVTQAVESGVPVPVIALSLMSRFRSRSNDSLSDRLVAALRREFGGHV